MRWICLSIALFGWLAVSLSADEKVIDYRPSASSEEMSAANRRLASSQKEGPIDSPCQVVVVYFTPKDRPPAKDHVARIRRIVEETARFYNDELARHGFEGQRLRIYRNADKAVEIVDVVGAGPDRDYGKEDGSKIRQEAIPLLRERNIDPEKSVLLIFCNMMDYDAERGTIAHHSPYYGGGNYLRGTAWQCDSEILDPLRFKDSTPIRDGEYGRITIGKHNSIFIGGTIHELGHALSLPHCREREDEAERGTALMGSGNQTYAQQLRGEGRGTFLTQTHALRLAAHPAFNDIVTKELYEAPDAKWDNLDISVSSTHRIRVSGNIQAKVPVHGVIAYFDPAGGGDYDATTAVAIPNDAGEFALESGALPARRSGELRLISCHLNGSTSARHFNYRVDDKGHPDISKIQLAINLKPMIAALRKGNVREAEEELARIGKGEGPLWENGQQVLQRFQNGWAGARRTEQQDLTEIPETIRSIALSQVQPSSAKVGWQRPTYDKVPESDLILSIDGDYFASGIYAHAPAKHEYALDGKWSQLRGRCGIQAGHGGKVDFEILADGKSVWRKNRVEEGNSPEFDIDLTGTQNLSLVVHDGGDGSSGDWGVWIEPTLSR